VPLQTHEYGHIAHVYGVRCAGRDGSQWEHDETDRGGHARGRRFEPCGQCGASGGGYGIEDEKSAAYVVARFTHPPRSLCRAYSSYMSANPWALAHVHRHRGGLFRKGEGCCGRLAKYPAPVRNEQRQSHPPRDDQFDEEVASDIGDCGGRPLPGPLARFIFKLSSTLGEVEVEEGSIPFSVDESFPRRDTVHAL